jgi:hypothetical protein
MSRAMMRLFGVLALLLAAAAAPTPGSAQQVLKSTDGTSEHVFIYFNVSSLDTSWRSSGSNRWQLKTKAGTWVDFPPEGAEIRVCSAGSGPHAVTSVILGTPRDRQDEIMAFAKSIGTAFANVLTERDSSLVEGLRSSSDIVVHASGRPGLASALQTLGFVPLQRRPDGECPNDHLSIGVPLARLDEVFTVIKKFPAVSGPCKF